MTSSCPPYIRRARRKRLAAEIAVLCAAVIVLAIIVAPFVQWASR